MKGMNPLKIAVSVDENNNIAAHLGKCRIFNIYTKEGKEVNLLEVIKTDGNYTNHIIEEILDCDVVISAQIGEGMIKSLRKRRIRPYVELDTFNPIEAIEKIY